MSQLTDDQIENWRNVLRTMVGPYADMIPKEEVQALRDKMQSDIDLGFLEDEPEEKKPDFSPVHGWENVLKWFGFIRKPEALPDWPNKTRWTQPEYGRVEVTHGSYESYAYGSGAAFIKPRSGPCGAGRMLETPGQLYSCLKSHKEKIAP